ncbi:MAG: M48 family metalloprotease, partial [Armatimonadetes bacterium]|nr:M48 family metalloprotease [Armatimonadota bacterium]
VGAIFLIVLLFTSRGASGLAAITHKTTLITSLIFIVLFSDVLEKAYNQGRDVVSFIVAHEMAHIKRHHVTKMVFTSPAALLFPFRFAHSRACECTCDAFVTELAPAGAERGMLLLSAGKRLFEKVNPEEFLRTRDEARGFWKWFAEKMSTHPCLPDRMRRLRGVRQGLAG